MRNKGQSLVELAIILPILLIILLGVLDLGRVYYVMVALEDMAAEGATFAMLNPPEPGCAGAGVDLVQERAAAGAAGLVQVQASAVEVECGTVAPGDPVTVTVPYDFQFVTPFVGAMFEDGTVELRGTATKAVISVSNP
jgi:hypothetical protein